MLLGEPPVTPFDINFRLAGWPIRITPFFWLAAVLLSWNPNDSSANGDPYVLVGWVAAVLLSILIHELGHAAAFRYFGIPSHVVLYHFGGLAIPDSYGSSFGYRFGSKDSFSQIVISLAGPAIQLLSALVLMVGVAASGVQVPFFGFLAKFLPFDCGPEMARNNMGLFLFVAAYLQISVYWALLNLVPVYPLDGGQVARELFLVFDRGDAIRNSLLLSVFAGGFLAVMGFMGGQTYLGILFGMLAFSSYNALQSYSGRGGY